MIFVQHFRKLAENSLSYLLQALVATGDTLDYSVAGGILFYLR